MITVNGQKFDFENGMTVADALKAAGEYTDSMTLVVVNGKVIPNEQLDIQLLNDGSNIKLMPIISGG